MLVRTIFVTSAFLLATCSRSMCFVLLVNSLSLTCFLLVPRAASQPAKPVALVQLSPENFQGTLSRITAADGRLPADVRLDFAPGTYRFQPRAHVDSTCGNCEDPNTPVTVSLGWRVSGTGIVISSSRTQDDSAGPVLFHTNAGYGLLFEDCNDCRISGITITGGVRDPDDRATDAAIVVKNSSVRIEGCRIRDNIGDVRIVQEQIVGIIGITGREGARIEIRSNHILRNSWDGIALYRGAQATIEDNIIDGIDKARGKQIGGGRGVGIGLTWDARAVVRRNLVSRYWKGIGIFVDARADVSHNVVEDILTWGIAYWDAGKGKPVARIEENLVYDAGACGISLARDRAPGDADPEPGFCRRNLVVRSGQNPKYDDPEYYCKQEPIAIENIPPQFTVEDNWLFENRRAAGSDGSDDLEPGSLVPARTLCDKLSRYPALGGSAALETLKNRLTTPE